MNVNVNVMMAVPVVLYSDKTHIEDTYSYAPKERDKRYWSLSCKKISKGKTANKRAKDLGAITHITSKIQAWRNQKLCARAAKKRHSQYTAGPKPLKSETGRRTNNRMSREYTSA